MKTQSTFLVAFLCAICPPAAAADQLPLTPVPWTAVQFQDAFWAPRLEANRAVTIDHNLRELERQGSLGGFAQLAGRTTGKYHGYMWGDSDVYKTLEGMTYSLHVNPDAALEKRLNGIVADIAGAQAADGYLMPHLQLAEPNYRHFSEETTRTCELYSMGHLIEAAVAHYETTGRRELLDVAVKLADLIVREYDRTEPVPLTAVPYCAWNHRGAGEMAVWLVEDPAAAGPHQTAGWVGSNYTPAYCVNQVQMWHDFRPEVIARELAAAKQYFGLTTLRVYLHDIPYDAEKEKFLANIEQFLVICQRHGIRPGFTFFDDCHRHEGISLDSPTQPVKGYHNGRWAACPQDRERKPENLPKFQAYVQDVIRAHARDERVLWWEIFNEPDRLEFSAGLRRLGYEWAKQLAPLQPVICCWDDSPQTDLVNAHNGVFRCVGRLYV